MCESALFSLHRTHKGTPKQYCYISNFLSSGIIWDTVYVKSHTNPYCYLSARALQHYGTAGNQGWSWEWSQGYSWTLDFGSSVTKIQTWIKNWCLQKQQRPDRRETATYKFNDSCTETSLHPQLTVRTIPMQFLIALGCSCFFKSKETTRACSDLYLHQQWAAIHYLYSCTTGISSRTVVPTVLRWPPCHSLL